MLNVRFAVISVLGFLLGCNLLPDDLAQLLSRGTSGAGQSVSELAPDDILDPNDPALDSPGATAAPILLHLSNPTPYDADCSVSMELIGRDVHLSLRRILAATRSLVIGPDRADIVRIDVTFLSDPPIVMDQAELRINRDFAGGDVIDFVLALPFVPVEGACCFSDGSCEILTPDACFSAGGEYQGDESSCDPNPCPPPTGACCFVDGTCELLTEAECSSAEGVYQGDDSPCDPNPCPPPTGACCFVDGTCEVLTEAECSLAEGTYQGDDIACDPNNPCPQPTGACCFDTGVCEVLTEVDCSAAGGLYQGNFIPCDPSPCPVPLECPADSLFSQITVDPNDPNTFWTYEVREVNPVNIRRFEDFFGAAGEICDIHWWGLMLDEVGEGSFVPCFDPTFEISFYRDLGEGPDPNAVLCSYVVTPDSVPTGRFYDGFELYYFSVDPLDACCTITDDVAWISIQGLGDSECWFYWMSSASGNGFSVFQLDGILDFSSTDFSLCLTGTPLPTGACCFGQFCSPDLTEANCVIEGGVYQGDGTTCDPNPCVP